MMPLLYIDGSLYGVLFNFARKGGTEVADIKTRDVTRGTIKTLDRAASSMHHLKEETIRSKAVDISERSDNDSANTYAQDEAVHYASDGSVYAARAGVELIHRSRAGHEGKSDEYIHQIRQNPHDVNSAPSNNDENIHRAFRERGIKTIRDRQSRKKMADAEVLRIDEENRLTGQIRGYQIKKSKTPVGYNTGRFAVTRRKALKGDDRIQKRRKEYSIRRITERNARGGIMGRIGLARRGAVSGKAAQRAGRILRGTAGTSKAALSTISISSAVAVGIITIMVFCSAAFNMTEDGNYIVGAGDTAIVEVARAQLGNVGGDKFWKWYGFNSHVHWCACFVSWCADQCGYIDEGIYPKFAIVGDGARWFKAHRRWAGGGYTPHPGDTIFFDFECDGELDHVGLVETCDGKTITTIEGNSGDACRRNTYTVRYSGIAGYGLMIRSAGNSARLIALKAVQLAYPDAPSEAKYHGGKPTAAYAEALKRAYPNRSGWGKPSKDGASCDVFVGTCLVDSGVDKGFPRGYRDQKNRLASRADLYECVVSTTSRDIQESELKEGDICTWEKSSGTVHIWIYAGGKARQASHDKWYPRTTSAGNNLKISGKKVIRIYRIKD